MLRSQDRRDPAALRFAWLRDLFRFLAVGGAGFIVDFLVFNALRYPDGGVLEHKPITARVIAVVAATFVTYLGNRHWTWAHRSRVAMHREYVLFFVLNGVGMAIGLLCLAISHYVFGLTSPLADNISSYVVGLPLGTLFRFWSYQRFVFKVHA
jgi:putative flippase GtrA